MSSLNANVPALATALDLNRAQQLLGRSLERLSSGSRIVQPADDPAGLGVSQKLGAQNQRLGAAATNIQNAVSFSQAADGMMSSMDDLLSRLSELATMATDPTKSPSDLALYEDEFQGLQDQLRATIGGTTAEIGGTTDVAEPLGTFNGVALFGPNPTGYQVTLGDTPGQAMTIPPTNLRTGALLALIQQDGSGAYGLSVTDPAAGGTLRDAIQQLAAGRASLGAAQSRLQLAASTVQVQSQNLQSAISQISDVDVAHESTQLAKYNIIAQAATSMLAQANVAPDAVLRLLQ